MGNGSGDTIDIESTDLRRLGVTFSKNVSITFGNGGDATLNVGTDGDPVTFDANASFSAGGSGNTYTQGPASRSSPVNRPGTTFNRCQDLRGPANHENRLCGGSQVDVTQLPVNRLLQLGAGGSGQWLLVSLP